MSPRNSREVKPDVKTVRCAVYTRVSTSEQAEKDFSSIDAQREAGEAYVASQRHEGWVCIEDRYDDPGYTGANVDRPGLQRLMADIEAGKVDVVLCYKVDRLSRSLLDFARLLETFDKHVVAFTSVTQAFNTSTSMGRLTLNILLSFAQFEREMISERTRDKIAAARRKGKWSGGHPILGYDVDPRSRKLVLNQAEASQVRQIFDLYLDHEALLPLVAELERRRWNNKRWTTHKGSERGGRPFDKGTLHFLLTNVAYIGQVRYKKEVHPGEHEGIVDPAVFKRVQETLRRNNVSRGAEGRNKYGALLKGLLHCAACDCRMVHASSSNGHNRRYRYYVCLKAQKRGWHTCPTKSISAPEIEKFVVDQIRGVGREPKLVRETLVQARARGERQTGELETEWDGLESALRQHHAEIRGLMAESGRPTERTTGRLIQLQERIQAAEQRQAEIDEELTQLKRTALDEADIRKALGEFDPVWNAQTPAEQGRILRLLVERVEYDGRSGEIATTFHAGGIKARAEEMAGNNQENDA